MESTGARPRAGPTVLAVCCLAAALSSCDADRATGGRAGSAPAEDPALVEARARMVEALVGTVKDLDPRLLEVLGRVPRHEFVPESLRARAYEPRTPLPIAEGQEISSAEYVAIMTNALRLQGDEKVLEIGTGSGYQAAVLGELVGEVHTIEIRPRLAAAARETLARLRDEGFLRYRSIEVHEGNGYRGYAPAAPYDAIIVTAAPREVPVALLNQLRVGGRMVIPVGDFYQELQVITRRPDGKFEETLQTVRFVRMVDE